MEADLRDALIAAQGGELPAGRVDELLGRLRVDAEFRRAFASEVWTLSLTRIAQAPAPRWLALYEELGLSDTTQDITGGDAFEDAVMESFRAEPVRFVPAWWRRAAFGALAACTVLAVGFLVWALRTSVHQTGVGAEHPMLAVVIQSEKAVWDGAPATRFASGNALGAGRLHLISGRASLMFTSGVILDLEGPADLELLAADRVLCRNGRLRTKVPKGAEGFCVETPSGAVTDLGTEFGVSISPDGKTQVAIFEGKAEISLQIPGQEGIRTVTLNQRESAELLPGTGEIRPRSTATFLSASTIQLPPLPLGLEYAETIRAAKPSLYWRLDRAEDGFVPNEVTGAPALGLIGGVKIEPDASGHRSAVFPGQKSPGILFMKDFWMNPGASFATELWFAADGVERACLVSLIARNGFDADRPHLALTEVGNHRPGHDAEVGIVRSVLRWPPRNRDGMSLNTIPTAFPYQWHHVVAQQRDGRLELYIDGKAAGAAQIGSVPDEVECAVLFGCLHFYEGANISKLERLFSGRMAEIAIYDRLLTPEEIQQHASLGGKLRN